MFIGIANWSLRKLSFLSDIWTCSSYLSSPSSSLTLWEYLGTLRYTVFVEPNQIKACAGLGALLYALLVSSSSLYTCTYIFLGFANNIFKQISCCFQDCLASVDIPELKDFSKSLHWAREEIEGLKHEWASWGQNLSKGVEFQCSSTGGQSWIWHWEH